MKFFGSVFILFLVLISCTAQRVAPEMPQSDVTPTYQSMLDTPQDIKLVVGITVDQMRLDYIYRYWSKYGDDGLKRLINEGYFYKNAHYSYKPTYTAPGHASIYTGTTPTTHGVIGNNWYDKTIKSTVYCAGDTSVYAIGSDSKAGMMSPRRMLSSTVTDELRLATGYEGKSIGISLKDRGAILPAGHSANAAYWYDGSVGDWITSSYYMTELPQWMKVWNAKRTIDQMLSQSWNTLYPIKTYTESIVDNNPFEATFKTEDAPVFPHNLNKIKEEEGFGLLPKTPFGNTATKDLAKAAIDGEQLGKDKYTDFLAVSFSSTDYVGHQFGPRSIEIEDTYLRLDKDIADLLVHLDQEVGEGNYTVFLTADHGAAETPLYLENMNVPAGYFAIETFKNELNDHLNEQYGDAQWIENYSNDQIFLDHALIANSDHNAEEISDAIVDYAIQFKGIAAAISSKKLETAYLNYNAPLHLIQRGYNQKRSGDIHLLLEPAWMTYYRKGTTHGTSYNYDTHVPIIFYGNGIKQGESYAPIHVIDIAPTLSALLRISAPNGSSGMVLSEVFSH